MNYDFSGWATRNNTKCSDGRTILKDAFKENDGTQVPLVWNHQHNSPENVIGHADLKNMDSGVYAYCYLNDNSMAKEVKELLRHGDVNSLSIYANKLKHNGANVVHGVIREVSVVLAGANPGAYIDDVVVHGDDISEAVIYNEEYLSLYHSEEKAESKKEEKSEMADEKNTQKERTVQDVLDEMTDEQRKVVYALVGMAIDQSDDEDDDDDMAQSAFYEDDEEDIYMKHNVFEGEDEMNDTLTHSEMATIIGDAKRFGSMKESFLQHKQEYGIENIEYLFPDAKSLNTPPDWIKRPDTWVANVMGAVHHTPFSRIKSMFADITEEDARARGYIKGKLKKEEVFSLLKRTTTPTTIYKKQKLDRDDVIDITDFDVIAWLKTEMRMMLDEEIARAILIGDGRLASSDDKINEQNIRPIWKDEELYTIKALVPKKDTENDQAREFIRQAIKARKAYRGSGNPVLFTTEDILTDMLLIEDNNGRVIYDTVEKLKNQLRVSNIVAVPVMENLTETRDTKTYTLMGIIVNLADYNVGADRGGAINMFDDFDIDYNQQKYLIETRISGALIKPFSAIALEMETPANVG